MDMPVCRHCGRDYITWFNLKRHIQKGHCARRWQSALNSQETSAIEPVSANTSIVPPTIQAQQSEPALQETDPHATAPVLGEPMPAVSPSPSGPLLSAMLPVSPAQWLHFARRPEVQETLRHFCATCGQWLVSVKSIKLHYRHVHGDIYKRFCQTAAADCRKVGHLISPCVYCGAAITRTDQHSCTCPVLWQARVCCLVQADLASKRIAEPAPALSSTLPSHGTCANADGLGRGREAVGKRALALGVESRNKYPHPEGGRVPHRKEVADLANSSRTVVPARRPPHRGAEARRKAEDDRGLLRTCCCTR